jgi:hypothetical protein
LLVAAAVVALANAFLRAAAGASYGAARTRPGSSGS